LSNALLKFLSKKKSGEHWLQEEKFAVEQPVENSWFKKLTPWYLNDNLALTLAKEDKDEQFRGEASAAAGATGKSRKTAVQAASAD
jgi:hypothetical protein